jgi:hypothetical protein
MTLKLSSAATNVTRSLLRMARQRTRLVFELQRRSRGGRREEIDLKTSGTIELNWNRVGERERGWGREKEPFEEISFEPMDFKANHCTTIVRSTVNSSNLGSHEGDA